MAAAYPLDLATVLQASKARTQPAAFRMLRPRRGMPYAQAIGTLAPAIYSVQFRFGPGDAVRFALWFTLTLDRGRLPFVLPIRTETGAVDHECQFLPDGLAEPVEEGGTTLYSATMMAAPVEA
jgi:hypothetical protein